MVNAGISFKFGQGNHVTNSRVAMAKELLALKDYVQKQDEKIEKEVEKARKRFGETFDEAKYRETSRGGLAIKVQCD